MKFNEAIQALLEGKQVVRESWGSATGYLALLPGMPTVWKILTQPTPNAGNHLFLVEDFLAEDWKVEDHKPVEAEVEIEPISGAEVNL